MIRGKEDITDKEFEEILLPFYNNFNDYMIKYNLVIINNNPLIINNYL